MGGDTESGKELEFEPEKKLQAGIMLVEKVECHLGEIIELVAMLILLSGIAQQAGDVGCKCRGAPAVTHAGPRF